MQETFKKPKKKQDIRHAGMPLKRKKDRTQY